MSARFWEQKKLQDFTVAEWESICCNCGRCCLLKLQDEDDNQVYYTDVVCRFFDSSCGKCSEYNNRCRLVPECLKLTPGNVNKISWMPQSCAYRFLSEFGYLPDWHPLVTGKPLTDEYSIKNRCISELLVKEDDLEDHIIEEEDL